MSDDDPLVQARYVLACIEEMNDLSFRAGTPDSPYHGALVSLREQLSPVLVRALCDEIDVLREYFEASEARAALRPEEIEAWDIHPEAPDPTLDARSTAAVQRLAAARAAAEKLRRP